MYEYIIICSSNEQKFQASKTINADSKKKAENIFEKRFGDKFNIISVITPHIQKKYGK